MRVTSILTAAALALSASNALAAGFEKSTIQSGKYMGVGGAATSWASGAEALLFNPAGMLQGKAVETTLNLSPTQIEFKSPNGYANQQDSSSTRVLPFGAFGSYKPNEEWAFGIGSYVSGGNHVEYGQVPYQSSTGQFSYKPDVYTKFSIVEISAGAAYRVNEKFRVGLAWRGGILNADQSLVAVTANRQLMINQQYQNLTGTTMAGFRLGAQYDVSESFGLGFSYRNAVNVEAKGKLKVKTQNFAGGFSESADNDMTLKTQLPQQANLGAHWKATQNSLLSLDYVWTNYGAVEKLDYEGNYNIAALGGARSLTSQYVGWSDQTNVRLGYQYLGWAMPLRFGYVYTSAVSSSNYATSTLAPPGPAHTLSTGTGYTISENFELNGAMDYTMIKGSVGPGQPLNSTSTTLATTAEGEYTATVMSLHLGGTYFF